MHTQAYNCFYISCHGCYSCWPVYSVSWSLKFVDLLLNQEIKKVRKNGTKWNGLRWFTCTKCYWVEAGSAYSVWSIISTLIRSENRNCSGTSFCRNENGKNLFNLLAMKKDKEEESQLNPFKIYIHKSDDLSLTPNKKERGAEWFSLRNTRRHLCLAFEQHNSNPRTKRITQSCL